MKKYKVKIKKPYIGYGGSIIQQNHGEDIKKGYYVWDIKSKNDWNLSWEKLDNLAPFVTLIWQGNVKKTLQSFEELHKKYAYMPGTRYRISSKYSIPSVQREELLRELSKHEPAEITFKTDTVTNLDSFNADNIKISKKSLTKDPDTIYSLYKKYIESNTTSFNFDKKQFELAYNIIKNYSFKFNLKNKEIADKRNTVWSIKHFKFDNLYGYGENNSVDFESLKDIVGIFGPNRSGKSSILGALMFVLFNATDRGPVKNALIINKNKKSARGEVRIIVGHEEYVIERKTEKVFGKEKTDTNKSKTSVNLWRIENRDGVDVKVSANGDARDDTDKLIRKLIGTPEDFLLTAFASQENLNMFISNKATKRKEILNRFLELDIFDKLYAFAKEDYSELDAKSKTYSVKNWEVLIEKTEKEISKLEESIENSNISLESLFEKRDEVKFWINSHEKELKNYDAEVINQLQTNIQNITENIEENQNKIAENKKELRQINSAKKIAQRKIEKIDILKMKEQIEEMDNLKDALFNLKSNLKVESEKYNNQQESIKKLKVVPCGNKFPNCHFIRDSHQAKKTIGEQRKTVTTLEKGIKASQKLFDKFAKKKLKETFDEYSNLVNKIKIFDSQIKMLEESILNLEKNIPITKKELRNQKSKLKKMQSFTSDKVTEEFNRKNDLLDKYNAEIKNLELDKSQYYISLGGKKDHLDKLHKDQDLGKNLIKKLKVYDSIQHAFSKNGIPAMVLENQMPIINKEIAKVLDGLVDFEVTLQTDTSANIMDIYFHDTKGKRIVELCSGMEKTICSMALRVALGNLSSLARPDILVLDESFGALDEESLQMSLEMLSLLRGYFKTIFVITHITPIKEIADKLIEIKNDGKESKVII